MNDKASSKPTWELWIQVAVLAATVVAIAVTWIFSARAERTKELTLVYQTPRRIISIDSDRQVGLEVRLAGNPVNSPWLLSGRLQNSGNLPIEERDIEAPLKLEFVKGKVLGVETGLRSQPEIFARATFAMNAVTLENKLLNPGDWIGFDILFDGEPVIPPTASLRISGVFAVRQVLSNPDQRRAYVSFIDLPSAATDLLLALATLGGLFLFAIGVGITRDTIKAVRASSRAAFNPESLFGNEQTIMGSIQASGRGTRAVQALIQQDLKLSAIDSVADLQAIVNAKVPIQILQQLQMTPLQAATGLMQELKHDLRRHLAARVFVRLPKGRDRDAQQQMLSADLTRMSTKDLIDKATQLASSSSGLTGYRWGELLAEVLIIVLGIAMLLILGGTWRTWLGR